MYWYCLHTHISMDCTVVFSKSGAMSVVKPCECASICQSTTPEGTQTSDLCIRWMWDTLWKVLKHQLADWHCLDTHITMGFSCVSQFRGNIYGCNSVSVHPYAHLPPQKVLKLLIYALDGCELQFERFYSLNHGIVISIPHLHGPRSLAISPKCRATFVVS